jgi:hypothetical protein
MSAPATHESIARDLLTRVRSALPDARFAASIQGTGVNWSVVVVRGGRSCRVACFVIEEAAAGLMLGRRGNAHLSKVDVGHRHRPRPGPQYFISFRSGQDVTATGRTADVAEAIGSIGAWVAEGVELDEQYARHAFVDASLRAVRRVAADVQRELTGLGSSIELTMPSSGEFAEAWAHLGERSARVAPNEASSVGCALLELGTQLMRGTALDARRAGLAVQLWLGKTGPRDVETQVPGTTSTTLADAFVRGERAAWHWAQMIDRAAAKR